MESFNIAAQTLCGFLGGAIFIGWMAEQKRARDVAQVTLMVAVMAIPFAMAIQMAYSNGIEAQWAADHDGLVASITVDGDKRLAAAKALSERLPDQYKLLPLEQTYLLASDYQAFKKQDTVLVTGRTFLFLLGLLLASLIARISPVNARTDEDPDRQHRGDHE